MAHLGFYAVLITTLGITGCALLTPTEPASKFFANPHDAALAEALQRSDWAGAERELHAGAHVNVIANEGMYPLAWTMYVKNKAAFDWLLNHGADPNISSRNSSHDEDISVLFASAGADDPDWLRMLLAHKANSNMKHKTSIGTTETPLLAAVSQYRLANMRMLIAAHADINYQEPAHDGGGTPLIDAGIEGFFEGVYTLIEAGADIRPRATGGSDVTYEVARQTGLSGNAAAWREKVLQQLRERGADVDGALKQAEEAEEKDRRERPWRYEK
jgi:ankyrin repeat protein